MNNQQSTSSLQSNFNGLTLIYYAQDKIQISSVQKILELNWIKNNTSELHQKLSVSFRATSTTTTC